MSDVTQRFNCVSNWARSDLQASHVLFFLHTRAHVDALPTNFCLFLWEGKISVMCTRRWPTALPQASLWQTSPEDQTIFSAIILSANDCSSSSFILPLSHCFFSTDFWLTATLGQPNAIHFPWYKSVQAVPCSYLFNPQELVLYRSRLSLCFVPADIIFQASSLYSVK